MPPPAMERLIRDIGRVPRQRTTLYADAPRERALGRVLEAVVNTPATKFARSPALPGA